MGLLKCLFYSSLLIVTILIVITLVPGIPPHIELKSFHIKPPRREFLNLLQSNTILDDSELYYESSHNGIESIVELDDNSIITSDQSGMVYKITAKQTAVNITQLKYSCSHSPYIANSETESNNCGWPLGMQKDVDGNILLMDYFGGMTKIDLKTGNYENWVPKNTPIDNVVGHIPEDIDVANDGTIYWTDGCTNGDFITEMIGQPSGRLIKYDRVKKTNEVLLKDLHFSNGVCLSEENDFVLVAEMGSASIRRYYLKGERKGQSDTFIDSLPGYPDNLRPNGRGGFYAVLFQAWNDEYSMRTHIFSPYPMLRKLILRVQYLILGVINQIRKVFPEGNVYLNDFQQYIAELRPILRIHERPKTAIVVELSNDGQVLNIFHGKSGKMPNLSQMTAGKSYAYMACPFDNKVWRIKLDKLRNVK